MKKVVIVLVLLLVWNPSLLGFFAALLALKLFALGRKEQVLINPYTLFLITPISLVFYKSSVSIFYLSPLTTKAQFFIILSLYLFFLGLRFGSIFKLNVKGSRSYRGINFIVLGLVPYVVGYLYVGWPLLAGNPDVAKSNFFQPIIGQMSLFYTAGLVIYFKKRKTREVIMLSIISLALAILVLAKLAILMTIVGIVFLVSRYYRNVFRGNRISVLLISVLFAFLGLFSLLGNVRNVNDVMFAWEDEIRFNNEILDSYGELLYAPYYYFVTPWTNLDYNIENWQGFGHGSFTSKPIVSLLQLNRYFPTEEKLVRHNPWNTHTFLADFYCDFGFIGALIMSFLLGCFVILVYRKMMTHGDSLDEALWIYVGSAVLMMFFSNHFTSVGYPVIALVLFYTFKQIHNYFSEV